MKIIFKPEYLYYYTDEICYLISVARSGKATCLVESLIYERSLFSFTIAPKYNFQNKLEIHEDGLHLFLDEDKFGYYEKFCLFNCKNILSISTDKYKQKFLCTTDNYKFSDRFITWDKFYKEQIIKQIIE